MADKGQGVTGRAPPSQSGVDTLGLEPSLGWLFLLLVLMLLLLMLLVLVGCPGSAPSLASLLEPGFAMALMHR